MIEAKHSWKETYQAERDALSAVQITEILEIGRGWDVSDTLLAGGAAIFPHASIGVCGPMAASVVHACIESGSDRVIALGVSHSLNENLVRARKRERDGKSLVGDSCRGIFTKESAPAGLLDQEFSLDAFEFLYNEAAKRRGGSVPELILLYPSLVAGSPETLPGIEELESLTNGEILVGTSDLCHHGLAYGQENPIGVGDEGLAFARSEIEACFKVLETGDYASYRTRCWEALSDSVDVVSLLHYLRGPLKTEILSLELVNGSHLFVSDPDPTWVAATLVECKV